MRELQIDSDWLDVDLRVYAAVISYYVISVLCSINKQYIIYT